MVVIACGFLVAGMVLPWLGPRTGSPMGVWDLLVRLPRWPVLGWVSYGLPTAFALGAAAVAAVSARHSPAVAHVWTGAAAVAAVIAAIGLPATVLAGDATTRAVLQAGVTDFATVSSRLPYALPRFSIDRLVFVGLGARTSLVASALRPGWLATAVAAGLLVGALTRSARQGGRPAPATGLPAGDDRWASTGTAGVVALAALTLLATVGAIGTAAGAVAVHDSSRAARLAGAGRFTESAAAYERALRWDPDLADDPEVALGWARTTAALGVTSGPRVALAVSADQVIAGDDAAALATLTDAVRADPGNGPLRDALVRTAVAIAQQTGSTAPLEATAPIAERAVVVGFTRGQLELRAGDDPGAITDLEWVARTTSDPDTRSAALTLSSVARSRSGQDAAARTTLLEAIAADPERHNLTARALALGRYATPVLR